MERSVRGLAGGEARLGGWDRRIPAAGWGDACVAVAEV